MRKSLRISTAIRFVGMIGIALWMHDPAALLAPERAVDGGVSTGAHVLLHR